MMIAKSPGAAPISTAARGAAWMVLAAACYAVTGAIVRHLASALPVFELAFLRAALTLLLFLPYAVRAGRAGLATSQLRVHGLRSVLTYAGIVLWFFGVSAIPLGDYYALYFTMPLFTIAGAALALRERVPAASWMAVAAGFAGALVIIRPGLVEVSFGALCALASALTYAGSNVVTRVLSRRDSAAVIVIYSNLLVLLIGAVPAAFVWRTPTWDEAPLVVALGLASTLAQYCYTRAIASADARVVQPFDFCRLPIAAALGLVLFGETSDVWTWIGAMIIFAAGSYALRRERSVSP
jgi:drug/metabolite transporter (DMT)-like permease